MAAYNLAEYLGEGLESKEKCADAAETSGVGGQVRYWKEVTEALKKDKCCKQVEERKAIPTLCLLLDLKTFALPL